MATVIINNFTTQKVVSGLNTYQYTIQTAGLHTCRIEVDHREASALTISITQSGSHSGTLASMTLQPNSSIQGQPDSTAILMALANCQIGDVVSFVLSSSAAIDQQLNTVKARLNIHVGGYN
jgi:hypothetical protein